MTKTGRRSMSAGFSRRWTNAEWRTRGGDLDVLTSLRDGSGRRLDFAELAERSTSTSVGDLTIRLAALDDIIESKRFANRVKDREALPELEQLRLDSDD